MNIVCLDDAGCLFLSPKIEDWKYLDEHGITVVIDLEGEIDHGIPTVPNHVLYIYYPIYDEDLPDLAKLHGVAQLGAQMVRSGHRVLSHCGMGFNRSALVAGLILTYMGVPGEETVKILRQKRPGALFNERFAEYLLSLREAPPSFQP